MILQGLANYYERLESIGEVPPRGYSTEKISFAIVLSTDGTVCDIDDLRDHSGRVRQPKRLFVPRPVKRSSDIASNFLWDKTAYAFGRSAASKRCDKEHAAFEALHRELLANTDDRGLRTFQLFLDVWNPEDVSALKYVDDLIDQNVVFRLNGEHGFLHDRPAAKAIWERHLAGLESDMAICLVTGEIAPIARLHPAIKGVPGAHSSGASIVSFNLEAFTSYGRKQGLNAPISARATHAYTAALNTLLSRREARDANTKHPKWTNRVQIGDATTVFWAEALGGPEIARNAESLFATLLEPPTDEQETNKLRTLLQKVEQGRPIAEVDPTLDAATRIYVLGISPNAARLSVRFFVRSTLGELVTHCAAHYQDLAMKPPAWTTPPAAWRLLRETATQREAANTSPVLAGELARAIFTGGRYPRSLLAQIIMRVRADGKINGLRAAIAKAYISRAHRKDIEQSKPDPEEEIPVALDRNETNSGYRLGRLFYVLENAQRLGIGRVNATIRDKFYASASANPARVFPFLLRGAQDHIGAVRRKSGAGLSLWLDEQIAEIVSSLSASTPFPSTLRLEDQGRFLVGYYHQRSAAKAEGKDAEVLPDTTEE